MKWAHEQTVTHLRHGMSVVSCSCGMKTGKIPRHEVQKTIDEHRSGYLREKTVKPSPGITE